MDELTETQNNIQAEFRDIKRFLDEFTAHVEYGIGDRIMPCIFDFGNSRYAPVIPAKAGICKKHGFLLSQE